MISHLQTLLPKKKIDIFGKNSLMNSSLPYYILIMVSVMAIFHGIQHCYFYIFLVYGMVPLLDEFFSLDERNPSKEQRKNLQKNDFLFKLPLYVTLVIDWYLFLKTMNILAQIQITTQNVFHFCGFVFIGLNLLGTQFSVTHEIFHKQGDFNKFIGTLHMIKNLYMHFTYEHLYGHHRKVATDQDSASAQKNVLLYTFFPKSYFGSYKSVYKMEKEQKKSFYMNFAVLSALSNILFIALMFKFYGIQGGIMYCIMAFGSVFFLQSINYVEHYGLRRKKKENGQYEKVTIMHSWNSPHRFSNYFLFKVQRHSDHHQNSLKPYQTLQTMGQSPFLPHGYTVCVILSFFPQSWFKIMNPLVDAYSNLGQGEKVSQAILQKARKEVREFIIKLFLTTLALYSSQRLVFG